MTSCYGTVTSELTLPKIVASPPGLLQETHAPVFQDTLSTCLSARADADGSSRLDASGVRRAA